jgi:hypothetical protein
MTGANEPIKIAGLEWGWGRRRGRRRTLRNS